MEKNVAQRAHAKRRASERYDLAVNRETLRSWVTLIQTEQAEKLEERSLRVAKYKIMHNDEAIIVVYDRKRKTIVTCLPKV